MELFDIYIDDHCGKERHTHYRDGGNQHHNIFDRISK